MTEKPFDGDALSVASITARLLAIAAQGEADGKGAMLSLARAALMDAAKLNGLTGEKRAGPALEDLLDQLDSGDAGDAGRRPGGPEAA